MALGAMKCHAVIKVNKNPASVKDHSVEVKIHKQ